MWLGGLAARVCCETHPRGEMDTLRGEEAALLGCAWCAGTAGGPGPLAASGKEDNTGQECRWKMVI